MQRNIQGNVQENRERNVVFRNRSGLETMLERVSDRVIQEVMRYMEDFAERKERNGEFSVFLSTPTWLGKQG